MPALTQPQYETYRLECEKLAILLDDNETPDTPYRIAQRRMEQLERIFENHWKHVHAGNAEMTEQQRVARALTRWMNGKRQDTLPVWEALPEPVQAAYMEQAADALSAIRTKAP